MKFRFLTAAAVCAALLPAQVSAQVNAEQVTAIGRNVLSMDDYMLAIQYFNQAIKAKPYLAEPYYLRGLAKLSLDDFKGAEADCSEALTRNKFTVEAYRVRGFARHQLGLDSLAVADFKVGLEYNPTDKFFLFYKGIAELTLQHLDDADATLSALLRMHPKFDEAITARARLRLQQADTLSALQDIESAISIAPAQPNPYLMRADVYARREQWQKALLDLDEAIRLVPENPELYLNRAYLRYRNDDFFGAMADYNYTLELDPHNDAALFNRALLRFEVRELRQSADDFSTVLSRDPDNFHARYNRGLIYLQLKNYTAAQEDFKAIEKRYPRFYPVLYALSECRYGLGDLRGTARYMNRADEMVRNYVDHPDKYKLDRPTIDDATANSRRHKPSAPDSEESDMEVMERFNQLVTSGDVADTKLEYKDRFKGRVQDRRQDIAPIAAYTLSFTPPANGMSALAYSFRDLTNLNAAHWLEHTLYLKNTSTPDTEHDMEAAFHDTDTLTDLIENGTARPVDYLARGVLYCSLRNYDAALSDLNTALSQTPDFSVALMARGYTYMAMAATANDALTRAARLSAAVADYDAALKADATLTYAWFNKGVLLYNEGDYTSALQCFTEALALAPDFGDAYYNRGLAYLQAGNRRAAFADLSKAGELGVLPSYNLLKRMHL